MSSHSQTSSGPLYLQITPISFASAFESLPRYSNIHKSAQKFLKRLCRSDLESMIEDNDDDDTYYSPGANDQDPRQQIFHLCDWMCQEIRSVSKSAQSKGKKSSRSSWSSRSSIRSSKSSIRFSTPSPPLHYLEAFLDTSLTSPTPTHMNDFSAQPAQGADNDDPSCDPVSSSLWFHVNTWVMSFVWLPRLVTSHPDYPLDEDTFINKVDIWWKSGCFMDEPAPLKYKFLQSPSQPPPVITFSDQTLAFHLSATKDNLSLPSYSLPPSYLSSLSILQSLLFHLPTLPSPSHLKSCICTILRLSSSFLTTHHSVKTVSTDTLISFLSQLIGFTNAKGVRSCIWALCYYDQRPATGGTSEYAKAVFSSAVEYLKGAKNAGRRMGYESFLKVVRCINTRNADLLEKAVEELKDATIEEGEDGPDFTRFGYSLNVLDPSNTTGILLEITSSQDLKMLKMMHGACLGLLDPNIVHGRLPDPTSENPDPLFETPLFEAIRGGNREIVGYLLKMGANRELKNGAGETPLMVAEKIRLAGMVKQSKKQQLWTDMVELLRCVPEELNALEVIAKEGSSKVIENLRMQDVDIWAIKDEEGDNLLLKAIKSGAVENLVKLLGWAKPSHLNDRNGSSETALHVLCQCTSSIPPRSEISLALMMISADSDINAKNNEGQTPLGVARISSKSNLCDLLSHYMPPATHPPSGLSDMLCDYSKSKNTSAVRSLIMQGANCDVRSVTHGYTPLIASVYNNDLPTATAILCDPDLAPLFQFNMGTPDFPGRFNMTPLHYCAQEGYGDMMALLLRCGGSRAKVDDSGRTPVDVAASKFEGKGGKEVKDGRDYNLVGTLLANDPGKTSVCCAAGMGSWMDVRALLMQGVDVNEIHLVAPGGTEFRAMRWRKWDGLDGSYEGARHELSGCLVAAAAYNRPEILGNLLKVQGIDVNLRNLKGQTPLMYAGGVGAQDLIMMLIASGAVRDVGDLKGKTAVDWARAKGMHKAANIIRCDPKVYNVVQAAQAGDLEGVKALISQGADVNEVWGGVTALIASCKVDSEDLVSAILESGGSGGGGVNLEAKDGNGETALVSACRLGFLRIVLRLLRAGCVRDRSASSVGALNGNVLCAVCVLHSPSSCYIHDACRGGKHLVAQALLMQGVDVNRIDDRAGRNASTALMAACEFSVEGGEGVRMVVNLLLEREGVRVNMRNAGGVTALMCAAGAGNIGLCKTLIKREADRNAKDQRGWNASNFAKNGIDGRGWGEKKEGGKGRAGMGNYLKFCMV